MTFYEWTDSLSVNIPEIDRQHKELIEQINNVADIVASSEQSSLIDQIDKLLVLTKTHFEFEESFLLKKGYPYHQAHIDDHGEIFKNLSRYTADAKNGYLDLMDFISFLKRWLKHHIMSEDRNYGDYLSQFAE